ncbi:hypothetical protein AB2N08_16530 [Massilia aurea]|uniref:hypothetical protein n=1 Tax=Massilia aurea TaxID=373040 RepID=UPI003461BCC2
MLLHYFTGTLLPAAFATCVLACSPLYALASDVAPETAEPTWKLSGFGTLGVVHSNSKNADFSSSILRASGAGASGAWSPNVDSRLGAQLDVSQGAWSGVLQVISEQRLDGSYQPLVEWANIKYQLTPDLAVRAGRIALPVFLGAESRKVGYTIPWVRTPVEVYGALPISSSDGVDATWRWSTGAVRHATQVFSGSTDQDLGNGLQIDAENILGLSHSIDYGPLTVRLSAARARLNTAIAADLFAGLRMFGPQGQMLAERYAIVDKRVTMISAGASYDPGAWFVTAETGRTRTDSLLGSGTSVYVGAGWRQGAFTPYLGYAQIRSDVSTTDPGLSLQGLPPPLAAGAAQLNGALNAVLATIPVQTTWSTGVRWDVASDLALKLQFEQVRPRGGSRGTLINPTPLFRSDRTINVTSVALDFVF